MQFRSGIFGLAVSVEHLDVAQDSIFMWTQEGLVGTGSPPKATPGKPRGSSWAGSSLGPLGLRV